MRHRILLDGNKVFKDFIKENDADFWKYTVDAILELSENGEESSTAFILYGGGLDSEKAFVVERKDIDETIERALHKMEEFENYEMCSELVRVSKIFKEDK